jgi:hypothetical protein
MERTMTAPRSAPHRADASSRTALLEHLNSAWRVQALAAAARLALPARLAAGPVEVDALAVDAGCEPAALGRLLRALVALDVVREDAPGRFEAGPLCAWLGTDRPGALGAYAEFVGVHGWANWARLADCVRTGLTARQLGGGRAGLDHFDADPALGALFDRAMADLTLPIAEALDAQAWIGATTAMVDVGGGTGALLEVLLRSRPAASGTVFDRPRAIAGAAGRFERAGLSARCRCVAGDFFESVPDGADLYLLKSVLHDWDDAHCAAILACCRAAMRHDSRLAVVERMPPPRLSSSAEHRAIACSDLNMMVGPGGRERTGDAYAAMLSAAGLHPGPSIPLVDGFAVMVATRSR